MALVRENGECESTYSLTQEYNQTKRERKEEKPMCGMCQMTVGSSPSPEESPKELLLVGLFIPGVTVSPLVLVGVIELTRFLLGLPPVISFTC